MTQLLVYESIPRNAALLGRIADVAIREVRSRTQLLQSLREYSPQVVAIELPAKEDLVATAELIRSLKTDSASLVVIAMPKSTDIVTTRWLHEAGVDFVFRSMLDRDRVAALIRRVVSGNSPSGPSSSSHDFRRDIFSKLPWKRFGS